MLLFFLSIILIFTYMFLLSEVAFYTPCDVCTNNVNFERVTCGRLSRVTHGVVIRNVINTRSKCGLKGKKKTITRLWTYIISVYQETLSEFGCQFSTSSFKQVRISSWPWWWRFISGCIFLSMEKTLFKAFLKNVMFFCSVLSRLRKRNWK